MQQGSHKASKHPFLAEPRICDRLSNAGRHRIKAVDRDRNEDRRRIDPRPPAQPSSFDTQVHTQPGLKLGSFPHSDRSISKPLVMAFPLPSLCFSETGLHALSFPPLPSSSHHASPISIRKPMTSRLPSFRSHHPSQEHGAACLWTGDNFQQAAKQIPRTHSASERTAITPTTRALTQEETHRRQTLREV